MYAIYLEPSNFEMLTKHMYCATSAPLVNSLLSTGFQQQAAKELQKYWNSIIVSADDVYADAEAAFASLDCILGTNDWFFNASSPGLFDATLFGYTHLILTMRWHEKEATLERMVRKHRNLVEHEMRLRKHCGW
jgi:metaxin